LAPTFGTAGHIHLHQHGRTGRKKTAVADQRKTLLAVPGAQSQDGTNGAEGVQPVLRFKPAGGAVGRQGQGRIEISNDELDDLVIARPDSTPTPTTLRGYERQTST
jgi:hypothetical protein